MVYRIRQSAFPPSTDGREVGLLSSALERHEMEKQVLCQLMPQARSGNKGNQNK
jgi:hypothetical protein